MQADRWEAPGAGKRTGRAALQASRGQGLWDTVILMSHLQDPSPEL